MTHRSIRPLFVLSLSALALVAPSVSSIAAVRPPQRPAGAKAAATAAVKTAPPVTFGPSTTPAAVGLASEVTLRREPNASSPAVGTVTLEWNDKGVVTKSEKEWVEVKVKDRQGWASWADVMTYCSAIVIDADTGATVARVPLDPEQQAVAFSPDGTRAVFYGGADAFGHEVRTSDYAATRSIVGPKSETISYGTPTIFYDASGELRAAFGEYGEGQTALYVVKVGETGARPAPPLMKTSADGIVVSDDGKTGFVFHGSTGEGATAKPATIDVVDMATFKTRTTMTFRGENAPSYSGAVVPSADGSELYVVDNVGAVGVYETRTGKSVRKIPTGLAGDDYPAIARNNFADGSFLIQTWGTETTPGRKFWIGAGAPVDAAPKLSTSIVSAGGRTFSVNELGTELYELGADHRIVKTVPIDRADVRPGWAAQWQPTQVMSLTASPDGKRVIMIVAVPQGD